MASYAAVKAASVDTESFSNAGGIRPKFPPLPMMIDFDAPEHVRRRRLVSEGFTPKRVRAMEDKLRLVCDALIDAVCEQGSCDFVRDIAAPLPIIMIGDMLGVAPDDRDDLLRWSDDMLKGQGSPDPDAMINATQRVRRSTPTTSIPSSTIAGRPATRDDLVGVLCHAEIDGDSLDDDSLVHETLLILIGGDETTRHVISGGMEELLAHPDQVARLAADPAGLMAGCGRGDAALGHADQEHGPHGHARRRAGRSADQGRPGAPPPVPVGQPRRGRLRARRTPSTSPAARTRTWPSASVPTSAWATSWPAWSSGSWSSGVLARLPDLHLAVERGALPRREANFISGIEEMPVAFTPSAPLGIGARLMAGATSAPAGIAGWSILVTGGGSGIGLATAERFAADGAHVTICGRTEQKLVDATERIAAAATGGATARYVVADVTVEEQVAAAVAATAEATGRIDGLFACAGGSLAPGLGAHRRRRGGAGHHRPQPDGLGDLREAGRRRHAGPGRPRLHRPDVVGRRAASPTRTCGPTACRRPASAS